MDEVGKYWSAIKNKNDGWTLRQRRDTIDLSVKYAERMNMINEGDVYILQVVGKVGYALLTKDD